MSRQVDQRVGGDPLALARRRIVALHVGVDGLQQRRQLARGVLAAGEHAPVARAGRTPCARSPRSGICDGLWNAHTHSRPLERPSASSSANLWLKIPRCASSTFSATRARSVCGNACWRSSAWWMNTSANCMTTATSSVSTSPAQPLTTRISRSRDHPVDVDAVGMAEADVERAGGGADRLVRRRVEAGDEVGRRAGELVRQLLAEEQLRLLEPLLAAQACGDQLAVGPSEALPAATASTCPARSSAAAIAIAAWRM